MIKTIQIAYLNSPIGIDDMEPLVSISMDNKNYNSDADGLDISLLDDAGTVIFQQQVGITDNTVEIKNVILKSYRKYIVLVKVMSKNSEIESMSTSFVTAAIEKSIDGEAEWITNDKVKRFKKEILYVTGGLEDKTKKSEKGLCHGMYFLKKFELSKKVKEAFVSICGLGYYHLYLNGKKIGDSFLDSPQTYYPTGALYSTFDISNLLCNKNTFLISLGNGRHIEAYGFDPSPRVFLYGIVRFEDGTESYIRTDSSWLCNGGPIKENSIYEGEHYDARDEYLGWESESFSVEGWSHSSVINGYPLKAQMMPPVKFIQDVLPIGISFKGNTRWIIDFGQNMSGIVQLKIRNGILGDKIKMHFSELLDDEGELLTSTTRDADTEDWYICKGLSEEFFSPSFTYHGFRYAEIIGYPEVLCASDLVAKVVHTDLQVTGNFQTTKKLFNQIHKMINWSQRANVMSIPTDCPQREERMGWLGDMQLVSEQAIFNFDMAAFYRKYLRDIQLAQRNDGAISDVTPPYWSLYPADPSWGGAVATILWNLYFYYGDTQSLGRFVDILEKYVNFLFSQTTDNLLHDFGKYGDWCPPACTYPKQTPIDMTSNFFLIRDTGILSRIFGVLRNTEKQQIYSERVRAMVDAFNTKFNNHGLYKFNQMSPIDVFGGVTSQVLPLALGIVPKEDEESAVKRLADILLRRFDKHFDCGIVGIRYVIPVLEKYGYHKLVFDIMSKTSYPSYGYMIQMGATTLWERWEYLAGLGMNSHNHIMFGSVDSWFYKYLGGIRPEGENWDKVLIAPCFDVGIDGVSVSVDSKRGTFSSSWYRENGNVKLSVSFPPFVEVTVVTPDGRQVFKQGGVHEFSF